MLFSAIMCNHSHVITGQESSLTVGFKQVIIISDCQENHPICEKTWDCISLTKMYQLNRERGESLCEEPAEEKHLQIIFANPFFKPHSLLLASRSSTTPPTTEHSTRPNSSEQMRSNYFQSLFSREAALRRERQVKFIVYVPCFLPLCPTHWNVLKNKKEGRGDNVWIYTPFFTQSLR